MILAGDIGGTHTRLALVEMKDKDFRFLSEAVFKSREEPNLESILQKFLAKQIITVTRVCLGVAGPIRQGVCKTTNLPWVINSQKIARQLKVDKVDLINDLEAQAYGIECLKTEDFEVLNPGITDAKGNRAIVSAGTGLGEGILFWDGKRHRPFASEGGHADFAPRNPLEMDLLKFLLDRYDRVSTERVISGQGLVNIYQFLKKKGNVEEPGWLTDALHRDDPAAVISTNAMNQKSRLCMDALNLFVSLYGAESGNLALKVLATGGVYLGGGIAPRIVAKLKEPIFLNAFTDKGRMQTLMQTIPVRVILNEKTALIGAARCVLIGS